MKKIFVLVILLTSSSLFAESYDARQSLISVTCKSHFEHQANLIVSSTKKLDAKGYTKSMQLIVKRKQGYNNRFTVTDAFVQSTENQGWEMIITGQGKAGSVLIRIDITDGTGGEAELMINDKPEDFLKLLCDAPMAG